jgi:hypothetical protein
VSATVERRHDKGDAPSLAVYSPDERYRYDLVRVWAEAAGRVNFVMLNPSTATEIRNDPTVERCERRARALGYGAFRVTNIFAFRATDPKVMRACPEPVGPLNDAAILEAAAWAAAAGGPVVCAWGTHGAHLDRGPRVAALLRGAGHRLRCLGRSKAGHPLHPLYIPYARPVEEWPA